LTCLGTAWPAAALSNLYDFQDGTSGSSIGDGGGDMYDGGNQISVGSVSCADVPLEDVGAPTEVVADQVLVSDLPMALQGEAEASSDAGKGLTTALLTVSLCAPAPRLCTSGPPRSRDHFTPTHHPHASGR
jgi:hypothetical protein